MEREIIKPNKLIQAHLINYKSNNIDDAVSTLTTAISTLSTSSSFGDDLYISVTSSWFLILSINNTFVRFGDFFNQQTRGTLLNWYT